MAQEIQPMPPGALGQAHAPQGRPHDRGQVVLGDERDEGGLVADEHLAGRRPRPPGPEIGHEGRGDVREERQGERVPRLGLLQRELAPSPVDLFQPERPDIRWPEPVPGGQEQHRVVTPADRRRLVDGAEQVLEGIRRQGVGEAERAVLAGAPRRVAEVLGQMAAQEGPA
jgi:hypothetical protein